MTASALCSPGLLCIPVSAWSRAVLGPSKPTFSLTTGFMIYQNQTSQADGGGGGGTGHTTGHTTKPALVSFVCVTWQMWDTAMRRFALADGAVSYLGKQGRCFLAGNLLQRQKRLSVVGYCVILDIMNWWPRARCAVAGITSLFCRSGFSVWFCLCLSFFPRRMTKELTVSIISDTKKSPTSWDQAQQIPFNRMEFSCLGFF